ncbi:TPA: radical SAM protein [Vibrio parahaemolyticus]|nr:radical SAM protein [Vibrio parahaemolyticus]
MEAVYNWHLTERCQFTCKYCFAKWGRVSEIWRDTKKTSLLLNEIKTHGQVPFGKLYEKAPVRINFAGGEPLLLRERLIDIAEEVKSLGMKASLITNGELLNKSLELVPHMDMIGISVDSFDETINRSIGRSRTSGKALSFSDVHDLVDLIRTLNPETMVKFNVVVNQYNFREVLVPKLVSMTPDKVKIFHELSAGGNVSATSKKCSSTFCKITPVIVLRFILKTMIL